MRDERIIAGCRGVREALDGLTAGEKTGILCGHLQDVAAAFGLSLSQYFVLLLADEIARETEGQEALS